MDSHGKPEMSRELLERLMLDQSGDSKNDDFMAPSTQSFNQRLEVERRRRLVRGYRDSKLGKSSLGSDEVRQMGMEIGHRRRHNFTPPEKPDLKPIETGQNRPSAGFKEPPTRDYNPFS